MTTKKGDRFARISLDYADHPKIAALSDGAFRAHVEMILYSRKYLTDGVIPARVANRHRNPVGNPTETQSVSDPVTELLTNHPDRPSLVEMGDGNYLLHDYETMQETRAEVEQKARRNKANGAMGGRPKTKPVTQSVSDSVSDSPTQNKAEVEVEVEVEKRLTGLAPRSDTETAQTLVAEWLDHCNTKPPNRVIGHISKEIKNLLDEGQPYADVRAGLAAWQRKGMHPSTLPSFVHQTRTTPATTSSDHDRKLAILDAAARRGQQEIA